MSLRLILTIAACVAVFGVVGGGAWWLYSQGVKTERTRDTIDDAHDAVDASEANRQGAEAAARATDEQVRETSRARSEADNARTEIARTRTQADATIEPVGPGAVVRADLSLAVLCGIERVRDDPPSAACASAPAGDH